MQDTYDESGRRVRKARVKAADKIAAHAEWVTHNPYRMPQPGEAAPEHDNDSAATADEEQNGTNGAQPSNVTEGEGGSACPSTSVAGAAGRSTGTAEDDDEAVAFSDGEPCTSLCISCVCFVWKHKYQNLFMESCSNASE